MEHAPDYLAMRLFDDLPDNLILVIIADWLKWKDIIYLDTACSQHILRLRFLQHLRDINFLTKYYLEGALSHKQQHLSLPRAIWIESRGLNLLGVSLYADHRISYVKKPLPCIAELTIDSDFFTLPGTLHQIIAYLTNFYEINLTGTISDAVIDCLAVVLQALRVSKLSLGSSLSKGDESFSFCNLSSLLQIAGKKIESLAMGMVIDPSLLLTLSQCCPSLRDPPYRYLSPTLSFSLLLPNLPPLLRSLHIATNSLSLTDDHVSLLVSLYAPSLLYLYLEGEFHVNLTVASLALVVRECKEVEEVNIGGYIYGIRRRERRASLDTFHSLPLLSPSPSPSLELSLLSSELSSLPSLPSLSTPSVPIPSPLSTLSLPLPYLSLFSSLPFLTELNFEQGGGLLESPLFSLCLQRSRLLPSLLSLTLPPLRPPHLPSLLLLLGEATGLRRLTFSWEREDEEEGERESHSSPSLLSSLYAPLSRLSSLHALSLGGCRVGDEEVRLFSSLPSLSSLDLGDRAEGVGEGGLRALCSPPSPLPPRVWDYLSLSSTSLSLSLLCQALEGGLEGGLKVKRLLPPAPCPPIGRGRVTIRGKHLRERVPSLLLSPS